MILENNKTCLGHKSVLFHNGVVSVLVTKDFYIQYFFMLHNFFQKLNKKTRLFNSAAFSFRLVTI